MFDQQRTALNPGAVEANRAGRITRGQRFQLGARATGAVLGWVSTTVFAAIAWWFVFVAETRWLALPGLIATVVAPIALWALYLIVADMRSGAVVIVISLWAAAAVVWYRVRATRKRPVSPRQSP